MVMKSFGWATAIGCVGAFVSLARVSGDYLALPADSQGFAALGILLGMMGVVFLLFVISFPICLLVFWVREQGKR